MQTVQYNNTHKTYLNIACLYSRCCSYQSRLSVAPKTLHTFRPWDQNQYGNGEGHKEGFVAQKYWTKQALEPPVPDCAQFLPNEAPNPSCLVLSLCHQVNIQLSQPPYVYANGSGPSLSKALHQSGLHLPRDHNIWKSAASARIPNQTNRPEHAPLLHSTRFLRKNWSPLRL